MARDFKGMECEGLKWIYLAQVTDQQYAVVCTAIKFLVTLKWGIYGQTES